jgi:uncharacterized membrane protein
MRNMIGRAHPWGTSGRHHAQRKGGWTFVAIFLGLTVVLAILNTAMRGWDPCPFILLNLFLSILSCLQGAILLITAKLQVAFAAALSQHDYDTNRVAKGDIVAVLAINNRHG